MDTQNHSYFLECCVASSLAYAIYCYLYLPSTATDACNGVRSSQAQIVVAVAGPDNTAAVSCVFYEIRNQLTILSRGHVPYSIRYVDSRSTCPDNQVEQSTQKVFVAACSIFAAKLNVIDQRLGILNCMHSSGDALVPRYLQLVLQVEI
eukprot:NODE_683_length_5225_cov_0.594616.p4 type:complete len:149 gc:universal NODE_683_length_5225_cov_0.594616:2041-2487(+)